MPYAKHFQYWPCAWKRWDFPHLAPCSPLQSNLHSLLYNLEIRENVDICLICLRFSKCGHSSFMSLRFLKCQRSSHICLRFSKSCIDGWDSSKCGEIVNYACCTWNVEILLHMLEISWKWSLLPMRDSWNMKVLVFLQSQKIGESSAKLFYILEKFKMEKIFQPRASFLYFTRFWHKKIPLSNAKFLIMFLRFSKCEEGRGGERYLPYI